MRGWSNNHFYMLFIFILILGHIAPIPENNLCKYDTSVVVPIVNN